MIYDHQWTPQDDSIVRAEHRYAGRSSVWGSPVPPPSFARLRCYADPMPLERPKTRYPKRWSRAKRKAARAREIRRFARWAP